jgi:hypothetical protein
MVKEKKKLYRRAGSNIFFVLVALISLNSFLKQSGNTVPFLSAARCMRFVLSEGCFNL